VRKADPIFAAIADLKATSRTCNALGRQDEAYPEEAKALPSAKVASYTSGAIIRHSHADIDAFVDAAMDNIRNCLGYLRPEHRLMHEVRRVRSHMDLDADAERIARLAQLCGYDKYKARLRASGDAMNAADERLLSTIPTTRAGIAALARYAAGLLKSGFHGDEHAVRVLQNIATGARNV
jgi:hypothetical protein